MRIDEFCAFIRKREAMRLRKESGVEPPWSEDNILATYRFCNIHREDDYVTRWISTMWREPHKDAPDLWFLMVVARLFNKPETLEYIGAERILAWKPEGIRKSLHSRRALGFTIFNGAYIVSTNGHAIDKVDYLVNYVLCPLWMARKELRPEAGMTLAEYHKKLTHFDGLGSFMAAQVIADLKYVEPLKSASDWHTFAAPGPGSRRGLNRVCGRSVDAAWPGQTWHTQLAGLQLAVNTRLRGPRPENSIHLHAQDLQNCLCEFDKYERARLGEGRPKQLYKEKS